MVELANLSQANVLLGEYRNIGVVLDSLDKGGRIVAMRVAPPLPEPAEGEDTPPASPAPGQEVSTQDIEYPPQMIEAIKTALEARRELLAQQLGEMGVIGIDTSQRKKRK